MANYRYLDLEGLKKYDNLLRTWLSDNYSSSGHNHDSVYKKIQTAVVDPTASGSTNSFIDTISQDAQGKISATKKTLSAATSSAIGGIKIGFSTNDTNRNYAVALSSEKAYVNVPWTDVNVTNNITTGTYYLTGSSSNANATGSLLKRADVFVNGSGVISSNGLTLNGNITLNGQNSSSSASSTSQILFGEGGAKLTSNGNGNIVINPNSGTTGQIIFTPGSTSKITINSKQVATEDYVNTYVAGEIEKGFAANDAMVFKGTLGTDGTITSLPTKEYSAGWTYKVITEGTYAGVACGVGDMVICVKDGPTSGTTVINSDWSVVQNQLDLVGGNGTTGIIKNGSSVTSTSGLTACPIISGVPYYKDTNTTSFTITANANDDDVVILEGTNGSNAVTYSASHATQGPSTTANTTVTPAITDNNSTAITGAITPSFGEYVKLDIPSFTVNKYGHVTSAANTTLSFKLPTPTAYTLPAATATTLGGIKVSSVNTSAVTVNSESTTAGRYYPVELNSDNKAIVNIPWADTKVTQRVTSLPDATAATYPLLFAGTAGATADTTSGVRFASNVSLSLKSGDVTLLGVHKIAELDSTVTLSPAGTRPTEFASGDIAAISSIVQTDGKISTGTSGNIMYRITDDEITALFN